MNRALIGRAARYGLTGAFTTGVAYLSTMLFLSLMNYVPATLLAWIITVGVGFAVNRRFTFKIIGPEKRGRDLIFYVVSALSQLLITLAVYSVTLARHVFEIGSHQVTVGVALDRSLAFLINLVLTTSFGFAFLNLVAFRRAT